MRIIDGLKLKGKPARIPDADRLDLPQFFLDMKFKKGVEIGVQRAYFTGYFGKAGLDIYGVDPWLAYEDYCPMEKKSIRRNKMEYMKTLKGECLNIQMFILLEKHLWMQLKILKMKV